MFHEEANLGRREEWKMEEWKRGQRRRETKEKGGMEGMSKIEEAGLEGDWDIAA
jgi:hypothetical protein